MGQIFILHWAFPSEVLHMIVFRTFEYVLLHLEDIKYSILARFLDDFLHLYSFFFSHRRSRLLAVFVQRSSSSVSKPAYAFMLDLSLETSVAGDSPAKEAFWGFHLAWDRVCLLIRSLRFESASISFPTSFFTKWATVSENSWVSSRVSAILTKYRKMTQCHQLFVNGVFLIALNYIFRRLLCQSQLASL